MKYKSVVATGRGSSEVLKIMENDLREPATGEVRIKILAVGVCQDDIATRVGNRSFLPKIPIIAAKFPILEAAKANDLLASGNVVGNVVLVAPELM